MKIENKYFPASSGPGVSFRAAPFVFLFFLLLTSCTTPNQNYRNTVERLSEKGGILDEYIAYQKRKRPKTTAEKYLKKSKIYYAKAVIRSGRATETENS